MTILRHAADAVARHAALAAVAVEDAHFGVGDGGFFNQHDAVAADAAVPVADADGQRLGAGDAAVAVVKIDVVVAAGLHLGESDFLPLGAQVVDVDELGVEQAVSRGGDVRERIGRVQRGHAGHRGQERLPVQRDVVVVRAARGRARVDDETQLVLRQQPQFAVVVAELVDDRHVDAQRGDGRRRALRGVDFHAEVVKLLGQRHDFVLVVVRNGDEHAVAALPLVAADGEAGRGHALIEGLGQRAPDAEHFAGRFHLRPEGGVDVR